MGLAFHGNLSLHDSAAITEPIFELFESEQWIETASEDTCSKGCCLLWKRFKLKSSIWKGLIHNDRHQCTPELANVMNCDHSIIVRHLHSMGKVKKSGAWVPHALSQNHKNQRVAICASPIARYRLAHEPTISYPVSLLVTRNGIFLLT